MWVEQERTRLNGRVAQLLTDAAAAASAQGRTADAVALTRRLLAVAPLESTSAHLAATTLIAAGRRHEAREVLKQFAATLDAELGLPLPAELQALVARLDRQAAASGATEPRTKSALTNPTPFVGREAELSQLVTLCRTTAEEFGGFALVQGDTGLGKSRLLSELAAHLKSLGRMTVLQGREHIAGVQLPYAVFAEALRPLVRAPGVVGASRHLLAEAARLFPELRDELDLPAVSDVEDEAGRLRFFEGVAALVDAAAFERPIVLIIDDVHLAGPSTLELLTYLCARLSRSAVTFVLALRPDDTPASMLTRLETIARPDSQTHGGRSLQVHLRPLTDDATIAALRGIAGELDEAVVAQLAARAEGIPLRLAEFARRALRGEPLPHASLEFREIGVDRLARLSSVQRRLLFVIALLGRPTSKELAGAAAHLPASSVNEAIDALASEGLVSTASGSVEIDEPVATIALELAGPSTRAFLSSWIADELAARRSRPAELARFYVAAGRGKQAFEQSRLAAFAALALGALPEAAHHLKVARSFGTTAEEVSSVESLLAAIGEGHRQLATVLARENAARNSATAQQGASTRRAPSAQVRAHFPNWRLLLGGAIATLIVSAFVLADRSTANIAAAGLASGDTLVVAEDAERHVLRIATGDLARGFTISERRAAPPSTPAWIDSLSRPWTNPVVAPRTLRVALQRVTPTGSDVVIISADRRDTTMVIPGGSDARALGWSPDGRWLLASVARVAGSFDADLYAFSASGGSVERRTIDSTQNRSVIQAQWSPDGTRIAWVARVGVERQLEVFVADADGRNLRNISRDPADDQHIAWSPDGRLLAFTSLRDGNPELYAYSLIETRMWRLTSDLAQDDVAQFSADGRLIAFESTRGGSAAVYVMPALGGDVRRLESPRPVSIVRWIGRPQRYLDRVYVEQAGRLHFGDSTALHLVALDQFDEPLNVMNGDWRILDSALVIELARSADELRVAARSQGVARVVATVGGWRADTALVAMGSGTLSLLRGIGTSAYWRPLGSPLPSLGAASVTLSSDREWDGGVLSRKAVPLIPGLIVDVTLSLPTQDSRDPAASAAVSLVAPEDSSVIDVDAPQFLRLASMSWNAESGRFVYGVGREFFSEAVSSLGASGESLAIQLHVEPDSTLSFRVAGAQRWRSSLRILAPRQSARAQIWVSARATGTRAQMTNANVRVEAVTPSSSP